MLLCVGLDVVGVIVSAVGAESSRFTETAIEAPVTGGSVTWATAIPHDNRLKKRKYRL